jgi:hypothetical protein
VPDAQNQLQFSFLTLHLFANGEVSFVVAVAVSLLILAVAWRMVRG